MDRANTADSHRQQEGESLCSGFLLPKLLQTVSQDRICILAKIFFGCATLFLYLFLYFFLCLICSCGNVAGTANSSLHARTSWVSGSNCRIHIRFVSARVAGGNSVSSLSADSHVYYRRPILPTSGKVRREAEAAKETWPLTNSWQNEYSCQDSWRD